MKASVFRMVSVGYVASNLPLGETALEVYPAELLPFVDGELTSNVAEMTAAMKDGDGVDFQVKANYSNTVKAKWLPIGGNQLTAPNVRRGMRVELWQSSDDNNEYYWRYSGIDNYLMRLETIVWAFSNTRDESVTELTPDNSWYIEISTHTKTITLQTNKNDGEPFAYTFQLDAKNGNFIFKDDDGQEMHLQSKEKRLYAKNKDGSIVDINKKKINMFAQDEINAETKTMNIQTETFNATAKTAVFNFDNWICNGNTMTVAHQTTINNIATVMGLLTMAGGLAAIPGGAGAPMASINIPLKATQPVETTSLLTNMGKIVGAPHTHVSGGPGSPTSPVV